MGQTKLGSMVESVLNTASGFILSLLTWQYIVCPLYGISMSAHENLGITGIFTILSVVRSYAWRRIFNKQLVKTV